MQWEKVKPKGRCQCHASSDGEGQSPNYLFHGVTLFWLCWNCQNSARKSVIAITFWSFLGALNRPSGAPANRRRTSSGGAGVVAREISG
jgi:hypothetical protein